MRKNDRMTSTMKAGSGYSAHYLAAEIRQDHFFVQPSGGHKADRHRGVEMRAGDIAHRVDHRHHYQTKGQADTDMSQRTTEAVIGDDRTAADEYQRKSSEKFCDPLIDFHHTPFL